MTRSIMVVAAHPDDEVLGCGGSIAKYTESGSDVHVVFLADGVLSRKKSDVSLQRRLVKSLVLNLCHLKNSRITVWIQFLCLI